MRYDPLPSKSEITDRRGLLLCELTGDVGAMIMREWTWEGLV